MSIDVLTQSEILEIDFLNSVANCDSMFVKNLLQIGYYILDGSYTNKELFPNNKGIKTHYFRFDDEARVIYYIDEEVYVVSSRVYKLHSQALINTEYGNPMKYWEIINILQYVDKKFIMFDKVNYFIELLYKYDDFIR